MAGVQGALFVPGRDRVALPRTSSGIGVFSMGSLVPESSALEFESTAQGESHTWRATREFALLGEILGAFEWGDARPADVRSATGSGADRAVRRLPRAADLVRAGDDPVRGGAGRRRAFGGGAVEGPQSPPRLRREHERLLLPRLRRDQAALRLGGAIGPVESPVSAPFRSTPSWRGTAIAGLPLADMPDTLVGQALDQIAQRLMDGLDSTTSATEHSR